MTLQEKLNQQKEQSASVIPPEALAIMHRATEDLKNSGILNTVLKPGDKAPEFSLPNEQGDLIESESLLEKGPLVIGFYRGVW